MLRQLSVSLRMEISSSALTARFMPRIDDCVDHIGSASFVSKLDLIKGYWQIPLAQRASEISAFFTPDQFAQ